MKLRTLPQDFQVTESLHERFTASIAPKFSPATPHALFTLDKSGLTTPDATIFLAKSLGLRPADVSHAGLKDRHAQTSQHISIKLRSPHEAALLPTSAQSARSDVSRWSASLLGFTPQPVAAADIAHNAFTISIRHLTHADVDHIHARASQLQTGPTTLTVLNLFGDQRFGSARHGQGFAAPHLLKDDFLSALKLLIATPARKDSGPRRALTRAAATHWPNWPEIVAASPPSPERKPFEILAKGGTPADAFTALPHFVQQITLDAFQSYLWNDLANCVVSHATPELPPPESLDLPSPQATYPPHIQPLAEDLLRSHNLTLADLRIPSLARPRFSSNTRTLFLHATNVTFQRPSADELSKSNRGKLTLSFHLPSGSYATTVLSALDPTPQAQASTETDDDIE